MNVAGVISCFAARRPKIDVNIITEDAVSVPEKNRPSDLVFAIVFIKCVTMVFVFG